MLASTLLRFDEELARARRERARWGYFPAMYRGVTLQVRRACGQGLFDDPQRMKRLVAHFAGLYFEALDAWRAGDAPPGPWRVAFRASQDDGLLVLQHLLLGMNAHINYDLALSAVAVAPGNELASLGPDFRRINDLLESLVDAAEAALCPHTPGLATLDRHLGSWDEVLADVSMRSARGAAWASAESLASASVVERRLRCAAMEARATVIAELLAVGLPGERFDHWTEPAAGPAAVLDSLESLGA